MTVLGKLEQVPLREVWKHEASDFTQWLAMPDNIDLLAEVILGGGSLTVTDTEVRYEEPDFHPARRTDVTNLYRRLGSLPAPNRYSRPSCQGCSA